MSGIAGKGEKAYNERVRRVRDWTKQKRSREQHRNNPLVDFVQQLSLCSASHGSQAKLLSPKLLNKVYRRDFVIPGSKT